ncbi:MAG: hypothetical protein KIS63_02940 [Caldilineales bacterium]|nr:hypothetical protein [Caldilineales bacterium]
MTDLWPTLAAEFARMRRPDPLADQLAAWPWTRLAAGKWDFAISTDPTARERHPDLNYTAIAADALAISSIPAPIPNLSLTQAATSSAATSGLVGADWRRRVQLVGREEGAAAPAAFLLERGRRLTTPRLTVLLMPDDAEIVGLHPWPSRRRRLCQRSAGRAGPRPSCAWSLGQNGYPLAHAIDLVLRLPRRPPLALRDFHYLSAQAQRHLSP